MRVLMVNRPDSLTQRGGDTIQMLQTKKHLEQLGVQVDFCFESSIPVPEKNHCWDIVHIFNLQTAQFTFDVLKSAKKQGYPTLLSTIFWTISLPDRLLRVDSFGPKARLFRKVMGQKVFSLCYSVRMYYRIRQLRTIQRQILQMADYLLPNSQIELDLIENWFDLSCKDKSLIVYNGFDQETFNPDKVSEDNAVKALGFKDYILEVARIEYLKGQEPLLQSLLDVKEIPIVFIGAQHIEPEYHLRCRELSERRGNVVFITEIAHELLPSYYKAARVHVLPGFRETPGLVSLEAAALGCNVVSTGLGSAYEYLGDDALYCDPHHPSSIREAILSAWVAPRNDKLQKRVLQYSWYNAAVRTQKAYESVLIQH